MTERRWSHGEHRRDRPDFCAARLIVWSVISFCSGGLVVAMLWTIVEAR